MLRLAREMTRSSDIEVQEAISHQMAETTTKMSQTMNAISIASIHSKFDHQIDQILNFWMRNSDSTIPTKSNIGDQMYSLSKRDEMFFEELLTRILTEKLSISATIEIIKKFKDDQSETSMPSFFLSKRILNSFSRSSSSVVLEIAPISKLEGGLPDVQANYILIAPGKLIEAGPFVKSYTYICVMNGVENKSAIVLAKEIDEKIWSAHKEKTISTTEFMKTLRAGKKLKYGYLVL